MSANDRDQDQDPGTHGFDYDEALKYNNVYALSYEQDEAGSAPSDAVLCRFPNFPVNGKDGEDKDVDMVAFCVAGGSNMLNARLIGAKLTTLGQGIIVTKPAKDVSYCTNQVKHEAKFSEVTGVERRLVKKAFNKELVALLREGKETSVIPTTNQTQEVPMKKVLYLLPDGMRCNNEYFNEKNRASNDLLTLTPKIIAVTDLPSKDTFRMLGDNQKFTKAALALSTVVVCFQMAVDDSMDDFRLGEGGQKQDSIDDLLGAMTFDEKGS